MKTFLLASILFFFASHSFASSDISKALFNAIQNQNVEEVIEILEKLDSSERRTVLNSLAIDKIFVQGIADPYPILISPLHFACGKGLAEIAKLLLSYGADINFHAGIHLPATPLHYSIHYGQTESVNFLLLEGANVNLAPVRVTPLMHACSLSNIDIVRLLLMHNGIRIDASFSSTSGNIRTALGVALHCGFLEIADLLIEAGATLSEEMIRRYRYLVNQRDLYEQERAERQRQQEREREQKLQRENDLNEVLLLQRQDWLAYERLSNLAAYTILAILTSAFYGI